MKKEWAWETDAVQHLYSISQSVKNQEKINSEYITYMLGALYLEKGIVDKSVGFFANYASNGQKCWF
ncbi:hypothetical protein Q7523_10875 [Glaesserella parasuis]|nr:hypothetical protein [Glaesserella parasuis]MDO9765975.1 hypothetical protein [Glaesserella parasuis]